MIPGNANPLLLASAAADAVAGAGPIKSLRFNSADNAYLSRTPASAGNRKTWTWSSWVKVNKVAYNVLFSNLVNNDNGIFVYWSNKRFYVQDYSLTGGASVYTQREEFNDFSGWYHIVISYDTTQATATNRVKIYINGVQETLEGTQPTQNVDGYWNSTETCLIGRQDLNVSLYNYDGYMADLYFVDGSALDASSFGAFDDNGVWQAATYSGTYGTNGFHLLDFAAEGVIGADSSGSNNDFTATNLVGITLGGSYVANTYTSNSTYDGTATGTSFYSGYPAADGFDGDTTDYVWGYNDPQSWVYFRPSGGISGVTRLRIYADYVNDIYVNGASATRTAGTGAQWYEITNPPSTLNEIAVQGTSGVVGRFSAIEINDSVLVEGTSVQTDVLFDVPVNGTQSDTGAGGEVSANYCTLNPLLNPSSSTLSDGNLKITTSSSGYGKVNGTIGVSSGKFYWEVYIDSKPRDVIVGIETLEVSSVNTYTGNNPGSIGWFYTGFIYDNGGATSYNGGATYGAGDYIGVALDMDAGTLVFYKNGVSQGTAKTGLSGTFLPSVCDGSSVTGGNVYILNFGQRAFEHAAPSNFKCLNTASLPTPTIADGSNYFDTKLWTGNGSTQTISGLEFSPDLVWIKSRSHTFDHLLFDQIRGATKYLSSTTTSQDGTDSSSLTAFTSDGFSVGGSSSVNQNSSTLVAWTWDAGANSSKTFTVKVVSDSGNKYRFDDFGTSAVTLDLEEGSTYVFDQSDSSNSGHPLRFSTTSDGTHNSGSEYTTGVTATGTPGSAGAKTTIVVAASAPTLYYYCSVHSGMGGQADTNSTAGASNFDGSIQATVRTNQAAGFSIVSYTGSGTAGDTIGHGLNAAPEMIIVKNRDSSLNWVVGHQSLDSSSPWTKNLYLNLTNTVSDLQSIWNDTAPTNSVFAVGASSTTNSNGNAYIAYCFSGVKGFSQFGSYVGDGVANSGPFVFTSFRPAFLMIKGVDGGDHWYMYDSKRNGYNPANEQLTADISDAEYAAASYPSIDFLSNGFKVKSGNNAGRNQSGITYMYMCFADKPFQANGGLAR